MGRPEKADRTRYSYADYATWPEGDRWEIVDGRPYAMTPSPSAEHQLVVTDLAGELRSHFKGRRCRVVVAPMDLKLSEEDVVQPDIMVFRHPEQNKGSHIEGPPAMVVEVLSPSSGAHDRVRKLHLYARCGVSEYWIVSPEDQLVELLVLKDGEYTVARACGRDDILTSPRFPDVYIELSAVFTAPPPPDQVRESEPPYGRAAGEGEPPGELQRRSRNGVE